MYGLTRGEIAILRRLSTPEKVQRYLDDLTYNLEPDGDTVRSPRRVMRDRTAHCAEGAFFAAAAFRINGRPPLLVDLEADNDDDHVLAVYRDRGLWGSVATSKFSGLRFRAPVYRTIRELVMSYFEDYFNWDGDRTLRAYSRQLSLAPWLVQPHQRSYTSSEAPVSPTPEPFGTPPRSSQRSRRGLSLWPRR